MKTFTLPAIRVLELVNVVDSIEPKELNDLKAIRLTTGIVSDLKQSIKPVSDLVDVLNIKQKKLAEPFTKKFQEETKDLVNEEEKEQLAKNLEKELNKLILSDGEVKELQNKIDELAKADVTPELSDEKFDKLQELFKKFAIQKYIKKEILIQVSDALKIE